MRKKYSTNYSKFLIDVIALQCFSQFRIGTLVRDVLIILENLGMLKNSFKTLQDMLGYSIITNVRASIRLSGLGGKQDVLSR